MSHDRAASGPPIDAGGLREGVAAVPSTALEELITAVRGLGMDEVRGKVAQPGAGKAAQASK
jgi:hypothetical protein